MLIWLNLLALGALEATFLWPMVCGLYWQRANRDGALLSLFLGLGSYSYLMLFEIKIAGLHAIVPALALGGVGMLLGSWISKQSQPQSAALFFNLRQES